MKKNYVRPAIIFDSFELAENIASCELISSNQGRYECPALDPESGLQIFSSIGPCTTTPLDGEQICYEIPLETFNIFVS